MLQIFPKVSLPAADTLTSDQYIDGKGVLMGNTIDNGGVPPRQGVTPLRGPALGTRDSGPAAESTPAQSGIAPRADRSQVQFSDSVATLQRLQQQIQATPDRDADRIQQVKQAIAEGSYKINFEQLADRMLALERALP